MEHAISFLHFKTSHILIHFQMLSFPPPDAGPKQVRAYVVQLLTTQHDVDLDFAETTADLWQLGRGVDFRSAANIGTDLRFRDVFGDSVGPFLYNTAREAFIAEYRCSSLGIITSWALNATFVIGLLFVIRAFRQPSSEERIQAFIEAGLIAGIPTCIIGVIELFHVLSGWGAFLVLAGAIAVMISVVLISIRSGDREVQKATDRQKRK